ncbi:MAG: molybdenum cofactor biosynthesis protein B [Phycisphaerae bacterium]
MGHADHEAQAAGRSVCCAVITCSDTRTPENDTSGRTIQDLLVAAGHTVGHYEIVPDEPAAIRQVCKQMARRADLQALIFNGGTGISRRDNTYDVVSGLLSKTLPGFGEIFRQLSFEAIGPAAYLSRAVAGIIISKGTYGHEQHVVVFCLPGSTPAVELAMQRLIIPTLPHLAWEIER